MNAIAVQPYYSNTPFDNYFQPTFFDEPTRPKKRKGEFCRVYNDGGHYIAVPLKKKPERTERPREKEEHYAREIFDGLYLYTLKEGKSKDETRAFLQDNLAHLFPDDSTLNAFIDENIKRKKNNLHNRKKRFRRKANLNRWTYFITITYDSEKHTEQAFRAKLRKCLCNLHTRRW